MMLLIPFLESVALPAYLSVFAREQLCTAGELQRADCQFERQTIESRH